MECVHVGTIHGEHKTLGEARAHCNAQTRSSGRPTVMPRTQQAGKRGVFDDGEQRVVEPKHAHQLTRARVSIGGLAPVNELWRRARSSMRFSVVVAGPRVRPDGPADMKSAFRGEWEGVSFCRRA